MSEICLNLSRAINTWQQQQQSKKQQQRRQQQRSGALPPSYVKLALGLVLQWRTMVKPVCDDIEHLLTDEPLSPTLHSMVALNAAVLQAWPVAAAAAAAASNSSSSSSSSSAADLAMHTLAAQRAITFTSEILSPLLYEGDSEPAAIDLMLSDDTLLLLVEHAAVLNSRAEQQQKQQQDALDQQQVPAHEQLLAAVGLAGCLPMLLAAVDASDAGSTSNSSLAPAIHCSLRALGQVFWIRSDIQSPDSSKRAAEAIAKHQQRQQQELLVPKQQELLVPKQPIAVPIDLAAVWQPLLQVVLQLSLSEAAAGGDDGIPDTESTL
jgi:hypothetical protein